MVRDGKAEFQEMEVWDVTAATKTYALGGQRVALRRDGALSYMHTDHLGSTSVLTDASGHEVAGTRLRYYPFGAPRPDGATGAHNAFATGYSDATFTGQRRDVGTGLYFYGARYYDSAIGRFLAPDTIIPQPGNSQALNRHSYVGNNPLRYVDPTGHCGEGSQPGEGVTQEQHNRLCAIHDEALRLSKRVELGELTDVEALALLLDFATPYYERSILGGAVRTDDVDAFVYELGIVVGGIEIRGTAFECYVELPANRAGSPLFRPGSSNNS